MDKILLSGDWKVCKAGEENTVYNAVVPGDIHNDLINAGVIDDPYYSDNSHKCGWIAENDWKFTKTFNISLTDEKYYLIFDGIDTVSEIYLNGNKVADTDNMFMKYRFDVTDKIKEGENILEVVLKSIRKELEKYPEEGYFGCFNVQRIFVRKAQCHFSWDWAPDFPGMGIWKDVYLETNCDTYINDYRIKTQNDGTVTFFVNMPETCERGKEREIVIEVDGKTYSYKTTSQKNFFMIDIENPKLWWPRFMGEQPLYNYNIKLFSDGKLCDEKNGRFGIRTVEIKETPKKNKDGFLCQLYVNGEPVFLKGANWVPLDIMTGCLTRDRYEKAIRLAYDANFSMLRVWGGGIYENEVFYEICDELGILVWQDFAYACADVPDNLPEFVEKAIEEAEYQVQRLRNYTSLVLYCGGNEKTGSHGFNKKYGDKIIYYYIRGVVDHLDGTRPYFPSSPWGYGDIGNTLSSGDSHYNSYGKSMPTTENPTAPGVENFRDVLKSCDASMVSEIAVQGAPDLTSLKRYIPEDKLWPINDIYDIHFMCNPYEETGKTFAYMQLENAGKLFGEVKGVEDFCKKSMTLHAEFVKAENEYHKSRIPECSGAMLWMFDDIWPCGTWSVVDYWLRPMPAYYAAKRAYKQCNIIITKTMNGFEAFAVNENTNEVTYDIKLGIMDLLGNTKAVKSFSGTVSPYNSKKVYTFDVIPAHNEFMFAEGTINGEYVHAEMFTELWKDIEWCEPELSANCEECADGLRITLKTKNFARMVNVASEKRDDLIFDDNYFDILPGGEKTVVVKGNTVKKEDIVIRHWLDEWTF